MTRLLPIALMFALAGLAGCGGSGSTRPDVRSRETPRDVINSLAACYRDHDLDGYAELLSDDFRFHFDAHRREEVSLGPFWLLEEDLAGTGYLFALDGLEKITIDLLPGAESPVNEVGKEGWVAIPATAYLDVEQLVEGEPEPYVYKVRGHQQLFHFRRGRSPEDVDPSSPTADLWYLVEWRDLGHALAPSPTPVAFLSWSTLKTLDR